MTARTQIDNLVQTLDSGADDFLPKPFAMPELISRVKAVSRRMAGFSLHRFGLLVIYSLIPRKSSSHFKW